MAKEIENEDIQTRANVKQIYKNEKEKQRADNKEYIPLVEAKQTIEIQVKPKPGIEQIETIENPEKSRKQ